MLNGNVEPVCLRFNRTDNYLKKASKAKGALDPTVFPHPMPIPGMKKIVVSLQTQAYVGNLN